MEEKKNQIVDLACRLLQKSKGPTDRAQVVASALTGDGSPRVFFRLVVQGGPTLVAILPGGREAIQMNEARSAWLIGTHLHRVGVPVPEPLAYDPESGLLLCEDLGDLRLYDHLRQPAGDGDGDEVLRLYGEAVRELARMQVLASEGFRESWCWQTPRYDRELMLARESGYFLSALCQGLLGLTPDTVPLHREFKDLADRAAAAPSHFFLHRDFQSRNLMLKEGRVRIIDFQGGRLGPLGYDLASLLIDPYVGLSEAVQDALLTVYLRELTLCTSYDPERFREEYHSLALQRNLQILGAFAFLGAQRGKRFFLPFIRPALHSLHTRLATEGRPRYPVLTQLVQRCQEQIEHHGL